MGECLHECERVRAQQQLCGYFPRCQSYSGICFGLLLTVLCNVGSRDQHSLEKQIHSLGSALIVAYKRYQKP